MLNKKKFFLIFKEIRFVIIALPIQKSKPSHLNAKDSSPPKYFGEVGG